MKSFLRGVLLVLGAGVCAISAAAATGPPASAPPVPSAAKPVAPAKAGVTAAASAQPAPQALAPDLQRIVSRGTLIVAMTVQDQPPFFMVDGSGVFKGYDVDLANDIARELGVKAEFLREAKNFNETLDLVLTGKADVVISKLSRTLARAQRIGFTQPYVVLHKGLLLNRLRLAQLRGKTDVETYVKSLPETMGVIKGSSYVDYAKRLFPKAKVREYTTWQEVVDAVTKGEILAAFRDDLEIKKVVTLNPEGGLKLQTVVFKDEKDPIAIAVAPQDGRLLAWLNLYLETVGQVMDADGLLDRYRGDLTTNQRGK